MARARRRGDRGGRGQTPRIALLALCALALIGAWLTVSIYQPFSGAGQGRVRVSIPPGASVGDIGDILEARGVISSGFFFEARATLAGRRGALKPGTYTLRRDMSFAAAIEALAAGPPRNVVILTVPEGRSRREVARSVAAAGLRGDYLRASVSSPALDPADYGAERARTLEGFLFPATYELRRGASPEALVRKQLAAFRREIRRVDLRRARRRNLTVYDVLTIASMVEREAALPKERPIIASVIHNRLREGTPLGIDATIRFATGNWSRPLTRSELSVRSAYNTRTRPGLPPGPIGSPGLDSIRAAAAPADTDFLFYVVRPGTCGEHEFSATLSEFEQDRERYNAERERRGGRSPTDC